MSKRIVLLIILLSCIYLTSNSQYKLIIEAFNYKYSKGNSVCTIFNNENNFPDNFANAFKTQTAKIINSKASFTFTDIPKGIYSIVVIDDQNNNKEMDKNWIGIPTEGVGCSRNPEGRPKYKNTVFKLNKSGKIKIYIKYIFD